MEAIQYCLNFIRAPQASQTSQTSQAYATPDPGASNDPIPLSTYLANFTNLTILDFFLALFLVSFILGVAFSFSSNLKSRTTTLVSIAFVGIIAFMSLKMVSQRLATDMCLTCKGQNKMSYNTQLEVIFSFMYANMQTFLGLILNAFYYFLMLYIIYILLRGHVIYSFGTEKETDVPRIMSMVHNEATQRFISLPVPSILQTILWIGYWALIIISIVGVVAVILLSIIKPDVLKKLMELKLSFIVALLIPFFFVGVTLFMSIIGGTPVLSNIDKIIIRNVIPIMHHTTIAKAFDFFSPLTPSTGTRTIPSTSESVTEKGEEQKIMHAHLYAILNAVINAFLYAAVFLNPLSKEDMCTDKKDIDNANPRFDEFKNRFLIGHYVIGTLVVLTYVAVLGGEIGKNIVIYTLAAFVILYFIAYMSNVTFSSDNSAEEDDS